MDDQFDKELKDHIREVFDKYEDPTADEGWTLLQEKFPAQEGKRRTIAWLWWSAAALLLLFLSFGLWEYTSKPTQQLAVEKPTKAQNENLAAAKNASSLVNQHKTDSLKNVIKSVPVNHIAAVRTSPLKIQNAPGNNVAAVARPVGANNSASSKKIAAIIAPDSVKHVANRQAADQLAVTIKPESPVTNRQAAKPATKARPAVDSVNNSSNQTADQLAVNGAANKPAANPLTTKSVVPDKSTAAMFASDNKLKKKNDDWTSPRVRFAVFAGTYFNYSKGSGNQRNLGGGFTADIRITKNLKLVSGVTIAQNSLNFGGGVPTTSAQSSFSVPGIALGASAASSFDAKSAVTVATVPAFKNYDASMVGLDIPVNLKYEFNPAKNDIYFLAGLSSGTFINETYTYQYNYPALLSPSLQQIQNATARKSFDNFYFAKMLNVAFGFGYPIGRNRIVLEPFVKYPLDGLGAQNIKFGSGGINLKFNFIPARK
jgi:hypothetical protein